MNNSLAPSHYRKNKLVLRATIDPDATEKQKMPQICKPSLSSTTHLHDDPRFRPHPTSSQASTANPVPAEERAI